MLLARDRVELRVARESGLERTVEVGAPYALELVVELDRNTAGFDDCAELTADKCQVRIHVAVPLTCARSGDRLDTPYLGGVLIDDKAAAEPLRLAVVQLQPVRHAGAREPVVAHQPERMWLIDRVGSDTQEASGQRLRDAADHLQVERRDFVHERREVSGDIGLAGAVRRKRCRGLLCSRSTPVCSAQEEAQDLVGETAEWRP